jgi:hypothetical protein
MQVRLKPNEPTRSAAYRPTGVSPSGWPDQKFKIQKIFFQNQKTIRNFFEKSETNQKEQFFAN